MEGGGLIEQLGIDWKLLLSQAVNFFILLFILRAFVYKPLMIAVKKRNKMIEDGLEKAKQANIRLGEVDVIAAGKLKEADQQSIKMIKETEQRAKQLEQSLVKKAEDKQAELLHQVELNYQKQQEESKQNLSKQAAELIKKFITKTVELKPEAIDEALINKAVAQVNKHEA